MGLQHHTQDMSRISLKYHTNVLFYTKYTHSTLICRGTDARTHGRTDAQTDGWTENIYSIFRDKLLLLGEHVLPREMTSNSACPRPDIRSSTMSLTTLILCHFVLKCMI